MSREELCPYCGGETCYKDVERLLRGGNDVAVVTVPADVCLRCGTQIYEHDISVKLEGIQRKLDLGQTEEFQPLGRYFQVVNSGIPLTGITDRPNPPPFGRGKVVIPRKASSGRPGPDAGG